MARHSHDDRPSGDSLPSQDGPDGQGPLGGDAAPIATGAPEPEGSASVDAVSPDDADRTDLGAESPPTTPYQVGPSGEPVYSNIKSGRLRLRRGSKAPWWELPVLIAIAIAVAVIIKTFLVQPFYIPSESMEKTLHGCAGCAGDRILVNKPVYDFRDPHPGDIVVFRAPDGWEAEATVRPPTNPLAKGLRWFGQLVGVVPPDERDLVKRVIAVGGQTVQCCDAEGNLQVSDNGTAGPWRSLIEPYVFEPLVPAASSKPGAPAPGDLATFGPVTVPAGRLWVMGDHRSDSADSRYHCISETPASHVCDPEQSTVPIDSVIGKAVFIAWPPSRWRTLGTPSTFTQAAALAGGFAPVLSGLAVALPLGLLGRRRRRGQSDATSAGSTSEPLHRVGARALLLDPQGRVLLIHEYYGPNGSSHWLTPGGGVEPDETLTEAVAREVYEETGFAAEVAPDDPEVHRTTRTWTSRGGTSYLQVDHFYLIRVATAFDAEPAAPTDDELATAIGARWWTIDELETTGETVLPADLPALLRLLG